METDGTLARTMHWKIVGLFGIKTHNIKKQLWGCLESKLIISRNNVHFDYTKMCLCPLNGLFGCKKESTRRDSEERFLKERI